jgi:DNA-binding CsgD family transcriptional regulator
MREQMIAGGESAASSDRPSAETDALEVGKSRWRLERSSATGERYRHTLESCMAAMASAVGADGCMGFQLAAAARRPVTTALIRGGESAHLDFLRGTVIGRDPKPTRSWEPDLPDPYEHSHTVTYRHRLRPPHPHDYEAFRDKLLAHGLHDHARRLLYDGRRFLGAVTVERTMDRPLFTRSELARLDEVANGWIPRIAAAEALDAGLARTTCAMLFGPGGRCLHVSPLAGAWATRSRRKRLADEVIGLDRSREESRTLFIGGTVARIVRVLRGGQSRYLATLRPTVLPLMHPAADLSERQRQVAHYAACGATLSEIASSLALSPHTVRQHLRRAYGALGVHNRAQLARAMEWVPDVT